jgi:hypothetical protein
VEEFSRLRQSHKLEIAHFKSAPRRQSSRPVTDVCDPLKELVRSDSSPFAKPWEHEVYDMANVRTTLDGPYPGILVDFLAARDGVDVSYASDLKQSLKYIQIGHRNQDASRLSADKGTLAC